MWRFDGKVSPFQTTAGHFLDAVHYPLPRTEGVIVMTASVQITISTNYFHAAVGGEAQLGKA